MPPATGMSASKNMKIARTLIQRGAVSGLAAPCVRLVHGKGVGLTAKDVRSILACGVNKVCHRAHPKGVLCDPGQPVALHILVIRPPHRFSVCSVPLAEPAVLIHTV